MPIYEFECTACGDSFERLQKLSDPDPTVCPVCGATKVKRCLTAPAFRLAGSGWYETDFKKDGDKKRNLVGKDEPPKSDSKTESGGEKKEKSPSSATAASSPTPNPKTDGAAKA